MKKRVIENFVGGLFLIVMMISIYWTIEFLVRYKYDALIRNKPLCVDVKGNSREILYKSQYYTCYKSYKQ